MPKRALGTVLKDVTDPLAPITVAGLTEIGGLELSSDTIDVTNLSSPDGYREFIGGLKDGGEVSISGFFESAVGKGQKELYDAYESGAVKDYEIAFPSDAVWQFKGIVTGVSTTASLEDPVNFTGTIKVSGKPTLVLPA
jgi:predicted secreted protein